MIQINKLVRSSGLFLPGLSDHDGVVPGRFAGINVNIQDAFPVSGKRDQGLFASPFGMPMMPTGMLVPGAYPAWQLMAGQRYEVLLQRLVGRDSANAPPKQAYSLIRHKKHWT
jgi:hypothetical protein